MRVIEKIEVSKLKYGCVVVTQNFLFNYSLFKIILNPSKKVEFSSENQKDMSVDGISHVMQRFKKIMQSFDFFQKLNLCFDSLYVLDSYFKGKARVQKSST